MSAFHESVKKAQQKIAAIFPETPLQLNRFLSDKYDCNVYLKREDLTPVRSYKIRGAFNFFSKALGHPDGHADKFVCASAGNHAQGFAYACNHFQKQGTVFMPTTTPQQKIDKTRAFGGSYIEVKLVGDIFDEAYAAAHRYAESESAHMVPPFDHPDIIEGQATVGLEILEQLEGEPLDLLIMPIGGGGLSAGVMKVLLPLSPTTDFRFVEPVGAPSLTESLNQGQRIKLEKIDNFVDGAAVALIGEHNYDILKSVPVEKVLLSPEGRLCATMVKMLNIEGVVLEPAGALSIDALADLDPEDIRGKNVVCVTSGGNFDFERLPEVKERALKYASLKKYFVLRMPQRPGALKDFLFLLGQDDDITRFEYLKKSARNFGSILIGIETKDPENFKILMEKFAKSGIQYQDITNNEVLSNFIV
ncbi:threonine ammonia-lyase IlvA [Kiloniella laminariae]|uniref:L-threonine dehydratase n=1 Tax=Kiloniella laminariae TaxID=454162 RepID=A0ABT4LGR5_9PROT|nr:threonine ammonia-lyase IlvA [Kiloniella laminariae]MCZ4280293.1 threonine ammonia-lyase IlvA [Kiloniella laminariae]